MSGRPGALEDPIIPRFSPALVIAAVASTGCAGTIDRLTVRNVVDAATDVPDTGKVCAIGAALAQPLDSLTRRSPHKAMAIAEGVSAVCDEAVAWEAELGAARAEHNLTGEARAAEITDASIAAARAHARTALRFERSFDALEAEYGVVGTDKCPRLGEDEEFVYLFGLVTGTLALLHDRASGGANDVPMDRLAAIARGSACLDDTKWWAVPTALQAAAWATVPGSGPAEVDAWAQLDTSAARGEASGVRVARAIQVLIAANSGKDDVLKSALAAHAAAIAATPPDPEWTLLDAYATEVSRHQSDLVWTAGRGHRTEQFGKWPNAPGADEPAGADPFGDPFAPTPSNKETP
jgi:hypothetical protein